MQIDKALNDFQPITLEEMDTVKMMNRIDTKYVINQDILFKILERITDHYRILEMRDKRDFPYSSLYYDTFDKKMYNAHHNGKLNRYKIRFRKYISSDDTFLEIKYKDRGIRTVKNRMLTDDILHEKLTETTAEYIEKITPFDSEELRPTLYTNFDRLTLVNKDFTERVTIDHNLLFKRNGDSHHLENVCIIETKRDGAAGKTALGETLFNIGIHPMGMSKYCIGLALIDEEVKGNNFKERILMINKIKNGKYYYRNVGA